MQDALGNEVVRVVMWGLDDHALFMEWVYLGEVERLKEEAKWLRVDEDGTQHFKMWRGEEYPVVVVGRGDC